MQKAKPPLVLIFGPFDPSGSSYLPADAVTCAALGAHALSTLTALHVQDTASTEDIQEIAPDLIDDQARCLLEDMTVQAIKVGPLYTTDSVRVLAQIAADYNHVPLVLHLSALPASLAPEESDPEEVISAIFELLLPQTDLVLIDHSVLTHWESDGLLPTSPGSNPAQALLEFGATWVLTTGAPMRPGQGAYLLQGPENTTINWPWQTPTARLSNLDGPLSCALAVELANGQAMPQAVENAIRQAAPLAADTFQPGMGYRLINRSTK